MEHTITDRGFKRPEAVADTYGGEVRVYESSAAMQACIWLKVVSTAVNKGGERIESVAHLTLDQAQQVRDQIDWLIANHYQVQ